MGSRIGSSLYVIAIVAVIVATDVLFFRNRFWERLAANVGFVLIIAVFYFGFRNRQ